MSRRLSIQYRTEDMLALGPAHQRKNVAVGRIAAATQNGLQHLDLQDRRGRIEAQLVGGSHSTLAHCRILVHRGWNAGDPLLSDIHEALPHFVYGQTHYQESPRHQQIS